jgi:4-methyl-5(b-hydroxyethyl)-thiazole monophosphate biosynthesis
MKANQMTEKERTMNKNVLVPLANGAEEIEAMTIIDVLRRAGADVVIAGVEALEITAAHGVRLMADKPISECTNETWDMIVLPGGMPGAENLHNSTSLADLLVRQEKEGRWYAAICAAPAVVLAPLGLLEGRHATCYPGFTEKLQGATVSEERVVVDGHCITSKGPGSAMEFAVALVSVLFGEAKADEVAAGLLFHRR